MCKRSEKPTSSQMEPWEHVTATRDQTCGKLCVSARQGEGGGGVDRSLTQHNITLSTGGRIGIRSTQNTLNPKIHLD